MKMKKYSYAVSTSKYGRPLGEKKKLFTMLSLQKLGFVRFKDYLASSSTTTQASHFIYVCTDAKYIMLLKAELICQDLKLWSRMRLQLHYVFRYYR